MGFQIRSDNDEQYKASMESYRKHLETFDKGSNTDLWRYFYWDFFHDGCIKELTLRNGADGLTIQRPEIEGQVLQSSNCFNG